MLLKGKIALVTGAGRGIGRAIALRFAEEGAAVALVARTTRQLNEVAGEIRAAGGRAEAVPADLAQESGCREAVEKARQCLGAISILVNNAGLLGPTKAIEEMEVGEWDEVMAVNLRAPFLLSRLILPEMYQRGWGAVINISSVAAKAAFQWNSAYAASKAGLAGLTRTLAAESARKRVRVNAICPGPVPETEMSQALGAAIAERLKADPQILFQHFLEGILQGRPQTAAEIAEAALFLASDHASAITGQTLNVDGGMSFY